jgi:Spy/CpxP family protein refolding chaperone
MARRTLQIGALLAALALAGIVGLTVTAGDGGGAGGGFLRHLHEMAHHMHQGGHHNHMAEVVERLELTPDQLKHLENVHEIVGSFGDDGHASMADLHRQLVAQVERGGLDTAEVRGIVDGHVEQIRAMAYAVADEVIALVNGLDATQRETLLEHLREPLAKGDHGDHGP